MVQCRFMVRGKSDPGWAELVQQWKQTQAQLRSKMIITPLRPLPRYVAGVDAAFGSDKQTIFAAAVVYDREVRQIVDVSHVTMQLDVPYIPGFLSFREGPAVKAAIRKLRHAFGVICFDGQGYAHPRRCGLASHVGIELDVPSVGVAKSRFIGTFTDPPAEAGSAVELMDGPEQIGIVLRSRSGTKPLFISIGHRVDLESARELVLACCTKYRIPEPTRQADIEVVKLKKSVG